MKQMFKFGLIALMSVCGLVGISRAQIAVTVDTAASRTAGCALDETTGIWSTQNGTVFGLVLKLNNGLNDVVYGVEFEVKDADGKTVSFANTSTQAVFANGVARPAGTLAKLEDGTYTVEFTLQSRNADNEWVAVQDVAKLTLTVKVAKPSITFTTTPAAVGKVNDFGIGDVPVERLLFPTKTAPKVALGMEGAEMRQALVMVFEGIPVSLRENEPIFQTELTEAPFEFVFKPQPEPEEEGEEAEALAEVAEYFPDGDYVIAVMADNDVYGYLYIRIGAPVLCDLTAVGAKEQEDPGLGNYQLFPYNEAIFTVSVENVAEGWFAVVEIISSDEEKTVIEKDTIRNLQDSAIFTTLKIGKDYYAQCQVFDANGEVVWENGTPGLKFQLSNEVRPVNPNPNPVPSAVELGELAGVNVYPNPNNGSFNVEVPERARIDIFGLNGAIVMSREANAGVEAFNIDRSGIYFVRVMAGNKTAVKRVVVR